MKNGILRESHVNESKCKDNERNGTHTENASDAAPPMRRAHSIPLLHPTFNVDAARCVHEPTLCSYVIAQLSTLVLG